jgi:hypothetical protein
MSEAVLATRGLKRSFTQGEVTIEVLRGVDLAVEPGARASPRFCRRLVCSKEGLRVQSVFTGKKPQNSMMRDGRA